MQSTKLSFPLLGLILFVFLATGTNASVRGRGRRTHQTRRGLFTAFHHTEGPGTGNQAYKTKAPLGKAYKTSPGPAPKPGPDTDDEEDKTGGGGDVVVVDTTAPSATPVTTTRAPVKGTIAPVAPTKAPVTPTTAPVTGKKTKAPTTPATKAPTKPPTKSPTPLPTGTPTITPKITPMPTDIQVPLTAVSCPDVDIVDKEEVWFDYSVEFSGEPNDSLIPPLEVSMLAAVEEKLLPCFLDRRRHLSIEIIGAIDYFPIDEKIDEVCPGVEDNCSVYRGRMNLYLTESTGADDAVLATRKAIRDTLLSSSLLSDEILKVTYLAPDLGTSSVIDNGGGSLTPETNLDSSLSAPMVTMISLGVVCVVVAFAAGFRYKNKYDRDEGKSTLGPTGSEITAASSSLSGGSNSTPGFSAMMPSTYRIGESHCMDAILEGDSDSSHNQSEIMVSDSGYSEEDSRDTSLLQYSGEHVLGASRLDGFDPSDSYLYDDSQSDVPPPSLLGGDSWEHDGGDFRWEPSPFKSKTPTKQYANKLVEGSPVRK